MNSQPWLLIKSKPGSLEFAKEIQKSFGGVIRNSAGWFWVDFQTE